MDISKIKPILKAAMLADDSVLMEGLHGIGKSEIVKQYCDENGLFYTVLFLSHQEVGDLIGMPFQKDGVQYWSKPSWLVRMEEAASKGVKCVLLLDELNRAQPDVLSSSLQLVLERQIHEHTLPSVSGIRTQVIACTNPDQGDIDYQVLSLDPALINRFLKVTVEINPDSWVTWARKNKINPAIVDFIKDNKNDLHFSSEEDVGATPRSWTKLSNFLYLYEDGIIPEEDLIQIIIGKIGRGLANKFFIFYSNYSVNISIEDVEKFIKKEYKINPDLNGLGEKVHEYIGHMESVTQLDYINVIFDNNKDIIFNPNSTIDDLITIFGLLYSFDIEILASFLKDKKVNDNEAYYKLMGKEPDRGLARKIQSKTVKLRKEV